MQHLYVDESGSMTTDYSDSFPFFVICILKVKNIKLLKKRFKRFISKNMEELKSIDTGNKMFKDGSFCELKGSSLTPSFKKKAVTYFVNSSDIFEIHTIQIKNAGVKPVTYNNTARAFNFFIDLFLTYRFSSNIFENDDYHIHIDERNVKTEAKQTLEDYLATEFVLKNENMTSVRVDYVNSCNNCLIQLSDLFSNIYYSYLIKRENNQEYKDMVDELKNSNILKDDFVFPKHI